MPYEPTLSRDLLRAKLAESMTAPLPQLTARDLRLPRVAGKVLAVIGVRRGGKTSFLQRTMVEQIDGGAPPESQLLLSLEDERLVGMTAADLGWIIEEYLRQIGAFIETHRPAVYFDEVQTVAGWETLVRRLADSASVDLFVSGSSARLLSREVATSLRGRALEVLVHPFSFREALRHSGAEPSASWDRLRVASRRAVEDALRGYLATGGFPEAQGVESRDRVALLKSYVDVMVLRDVIDRHAVSNTQALRWLQRHLLATPAGAFTIKKLYDALRSQGVAVAKDTLYAHLEHLQDAFLIRTVAMHSTSERQRMANPRKAYPIDPGLIAVYERTGREHQGRALETAIYLELERRGYDVDWMRTPDGWEVDFFAERHGEPPLLVQVALETAADETWDREVRGLTDGLGAHRRARGLLVTLDSAPPSRPLPPRVDWMSAARWLLEAE